MPTTCRANCALSHFVSSLWFRLCCSQSLCPWAMFGRAFLDHCVMCKNVVVPLMFQLCKVHFDVVYICVGVAVTVAALRFTFVSALSFSFNSILCQYLCCMYCAVVHMSSSIASCCMYLVWQGNLQGIKLRRGKNYDETQLDPEANVPGTCAFSVVCLVIPQRLSLILLAFACGLSTWASNTQVCTLIWSLASSALSVQPAPLLRQLFQPSDRCQELDGVEGCFRPWSSFHQDLCFFLGDKSSSLHFLDLNLCVPQQHFVLVPQSYPRLQRTAAACSL